VSLLSEKYLKGRTRWIPAFLTGWRTNDLSKQDLHQASSIIYFFKHAD
jgi:hypothetical protein